ncbi:MAG: hypothetical protein LBU34_15065 [Planctomycetaceae bacterium]|jgi:hypothetical protein|nr:hypothetical protein [Planctomycetaceae bacterium]
MSQPSIFDVEYQLDKINQINDFLRRLDELIDWSIFLDLLNQVRSYLSILILRFWVWAYG